MIIFLAAGTQDGRELAHLLLSRGYDLIASVTTAYGERLLAEQEQAGGTRGHLMIQDKPMEPDEMRSYFMEHHVDAVVDATHPYAVNVSRNLMAICEAQNLPYIRYERDLTEIAKNGKVHIVETYEEAALCAAQLGSHIFLTTGSHSLSHFTRAKCLNGKILFARVLPSSEVLKLCEVEGLSPKQIFAVQGPFSVEMNRVMLKDTGADVMVTKNSGSLGGTDTKLQAARELGIPVVLIDRPKLAYPHIAHRYEGVCDFLRELGEIR